MGLSAMLPTLVLTDGVGATATPGGTDAPLAAALPGTGRPGPSPGEDGRAETKGSAFREGFGVLTGELMTDPSMATATGCFDLAAGTWLAEAVPPVLPRLPEIAQRYESGVAGQIVSRSSGYDC
jgi:hypothetical protein